MEATNTDFYAYQFKPVLKLLQTPTNGILIADVVGLGKTIEAGLIWTELRSRFNLNRLVILCPTALREKWHDELTNKMGLSPQICNAKEMLLILKDEKAHAKGFSIIASTQGLRPPRGWEDDKTSNAAELARLLVKAFQSYEGLKDFEKIQFEGYVLQRFAVVQRAYRTADETAFKLGAENLRDRAKVNIRYSSRTLVCVNVIRS